MGGANRRMDKMRAAPIVRLGGRIAQGVGR